VKMTLQSVFRIEAEEPYKERSMPCFNHFLLLTETNDLEGFS
jgi:hypothetical protein